MPHDFSNLVVSSFLAFRIYFCFKWLICIPCLQFFFSSFFLCVLVGARTRRACWTNVLHCRQAVIIKVKSRVV